MTEKEVIGKILADWTEELIQDMKRDLDSRTKSKSDQLSSSIEPEYIVTNAGITMQLYIADYYQFVDEGVSGVEKPISGSPFSFKFKRPGKKFAQQIQGWIADASVPDKTRKGDFSKDKPSPLSYAIATSIKKRGLKPKLFFKANLTQDRIQKLQDMLSAELSRQIQITLLA